MAGRKAPWMLSFVGLLVVVGFGLARPSEAAPSSITGDDPLPAGRLTGSDLQAFFDPYITQSMTAAHTPGAVVIFVKDGSILYARGYGNADLSRGVPVDPDRTVFRIASVSKLLTTMAVVQLADRHRVQLDADVNRYLRRFQVPATYPQPVTLTTLLTHTAGFEERTVGRAMLTPSGIPSLDTYLATRMPERVTAPGTFYSYSNFGFALAGDVVESVSGQPFDRYVAREIFTPLGMDHSSFAQPLPGDLADSVATGYDVVGTRPDPAPFEYFADPPAEAMSTTAADMARFMVFQLDERPSAGRVLSARALADMHALHFHASPDADLNGMAYGFNRYQRNGVWILSKEGDIRGFSSYLALFPDQHLGYFVAANNSDSAWMQDLERRFVNRYFPMPPGTSPTTPPSLRGSLAAFTGIYVPNRSSRSTIEKLRTLTQQIEIADVGNGQIDVRYPDGGDVRLTRVGPLAFANDYEGGVYHWAFLSDSEGEIGHFLIGNDVYNRIPWYEARSIQLGIAASFALLFFIGLSLGLSPRLSRQRSDRPIPGALAARGTRLAGLTHALARILCGVNLVFLVAIAVILYSATATQNLDYSWVTYGPPRLVYVVLCLPLVTIALAIAIVVGIALACRGRAWRGAEYRYAVVAAIAQIAFIPFLVHWNLLGFHV